VDNFTHSLTGWALGQAGLKQKSRKGLAALILGANAPDIDVFFSWFPWEPLATHRGVTHSILGTAILPLALWALLLALDRWQVRRGATFKSGLALHPGWLLALCYIGAATHPLLDLQTTYSVQLLSPFSGRWFHADSLFIIDVWMWSLLALAIAWSRRQERRGRPHWQRPVIGALAVGFAYICFNIGISQSAAATVRTRLPEARSIFASPPPVRPWRRDLSWREPGGLGGAGWSILGGLEPPSPLAPDGMDDPIVRRAIREDRALRRFLNWSVLPIARVERDGCTARVKIEDARYGLPGERNRGPLSRTASVNLCR
jgi:inner membrane protein